ncbi:homeobox protein 4 [Diaphorina citri]|uniref:Homeobox protein 4 n=1 Tax=Diaphorina citri TaxID=121845 RepID=A0A1S3CTU8_DIACI|nr:homeobox protein 4 [Diaphorina citri]
MKTSPNSMSSSHSSEDGVQRLRIVHGIVNNWRATPVSMSEETTKDQARPPIYNPEDYAVALKKFTKRTPPPSETCDNADTNGDINGGGEMSLRQFSSASELLNKLKTDLRVAYPSFVQEFVGDQIDGVNLLLELLKCIQATQSHQQGRAPPPVLRRSLIDENACLLCLLHCLRCQDSGRILATSSSGLYALAVSTMSNVTKSRITALQLLTRTCETPDSNGHTQVSEAMSTLRLKFGEPVRFQFLIGMIIGSNMDLICTGLKFLNAFIRTAPSMQSKLYIQAEIMQAGLNIDLVRKTCQDSELVAQEINTWEKNFIDLEKMKKSAEDSKQENLSLREKIALLERKIQKLHEEKSALMNIENQWKDRYNKLLDKKHRNKEITEYDKDDKRNVIHIEDEGISSSELEEDIKRISDEELENEGRRKIMKDESEDEEKEIVPTKLLPQPPRKYIINYCDHDGDEEEANQRINGFFDDDDEISENSNYYCTQNTLISKKQETLTSSDNKPPQHNNTNHINKINLNITSPRNSKKDLISSSDNSSNSNSDDSNRSFNYYIQNTTQYKNTDTIRSREKLDETNTKTSTNNKSIKINSTEPVSQTNNKTHTDQSINKPNETTNQVKISTKPAHNTNRKHDDHYKHDNKSVRTSFGQTNYKNLVFSKQPQQQYDSRIKPQKDNADKYSSREQPVEIQHDRNIVLKRSETFHNVQNRIHNYQNVNTRTSNSNHVQNIVKPRRNNIPVNSGHYEDTQSENIKRNMHHQYNIRRSSFDGLFYITANGSQAKTSTNTNNNRENDNVNMINSNYFNYVNIKFNNDNHNGTASTASSGKKYKSLEGISDGLESMVDIVVTNNNGSNSKLNDSRRGHIYKNIKYDRKNSSLCKLSDLPSGLY